MPISFFFTSRLPANLIMVSLLKLSLKHKKCLSLIWNMAALITSCGFPGILCGKDYNSFVCHGYPIHDGYFIPEAWYCVMSWLTSFIVNGQPLMTYLLSFVYGHQFVSSSCMSLIDRHCSMSVAALCLYLVSHLLFLHQYFLHHYILITNLLCTDQDVVFGSCPLYNEVFED